MLEKYLWSATMEYAVNHPALRGAQGFFLQREKNVDG